MAKGDKEKIQKFAKQNNKSVNSFITELIDEAMTCDRTTTLTSPQPDQPTQQRQSFEEYLKTLPKSVMLTGNKEDLYMQHRESLGLA